MLRVKCCVGESSIPDAGKGLFSDQALCKGEIIVFPDQVQRVYSRDELMELPRDSAEFNSSIRWFDDGYTVDPEKSDIFYLNHSFTPNCLWHLGFIFALEDIPRHTELTIDYRVLMDDSAELEFHDSLTGTPIRGLPWQRKIIMTSAQLAGLFEAVETA